MDSKYLEVFIDESQENLQAINDSLLELENDPDNIDIVNTIFRAAHTLKGMAGSMGFEDLADLTHKMENVLDAIRNHKAKVTSDVLDVVFKSVDHLEAMIDDISSGGTGKHDVKETVDALNAIEKGEDTIDQMSNNASGTTEEIPIEIKEIIEQSFSEGYNVYRIDVALVDSCQLKGPRSFMVMDQLKPLGEVLHSSPSMELIENGEFEEHFSLYYRTEHDDKKIGSEINKVSEIKSVTLQSLKESQPLIDIPFDEFELTVLQQSIEQGLTPYTVHITLSEKTVLKSARAVMVFDAIEKIGDIIKSTPDVESLEDEKFDYDFYVSFISNESIDAIENELNKISEIDAINIQKIKLGAAQNENDKQEESTEKTPNEKEDQKEKKTKKVAKQTIRVNTDRIDRLMNLFEELVIDKGRLEQISTELKHNDLSETVERMSRISGDLQNIILNMRMVPVEQVFNRFPRMVRGLARDLDKKVNLQVVGAETEMDRNVIDELGDPLVHLIRNAVDHGIETPDIRKKAGKNETGTVILKAFHSGNHVFVEIKEDGAGIDPKIVAKKAVSNGVLSQDEVDKMSDEAIHQLIFASGFSTAETISDVSGRGVGLDVVKSTIQSLGGDVHIESEQGKGTTFSIQLPLTLSIIPSMLVDVQNEKYAIPLSSIIETAVIKQDDVFSAQNKKVINFRGKIIPLVFLDETFHIPKTIDRDNYSVVIVRKGDKLSALVVDKFIGQLEIVLKSLGIYLKNVFAISGATILGDGEVALIVDCNALIK